MTEQSPTAARKKRPRFSLKWELVAIVIACWLLPILLVLGALAYYVENDVRRQMDDNIRTSVNHATYLTKHMLETAVSASRNATYDGALLDAYKRYLASETESRALLYGKVDDFLTRQYRYDEKFVATMLCFLEEPDTVYYTYSPHSSAYTDVLRYRHSVHSQVLELSAGLDTGIGFVSGPDGLYMVRNLVDVHNHLQPYGVIVMQLNTDMMFAGFNNIMWRTGATLFLNGAPVDLHPEAPLPPPEELGVRLRKGAPVSTPTDPMLVSGGFDTETDAVRVHYVVQVDRMAFIQELSGFLEIIYLLTVFLIPLLALAVWFFYRNIFRPMNRIVAAAKTIQGGQLGYQMAERSGNVEFAYLTETFNSMSARLKEQFDRIYSEELALRDARIMALQSQINPHFLNNTLEIINWDARLAGNHKVSRMIEALSIMLDAAMDRHSSPLVPLSQEMEYVDAYLFIIGERFGKRLTVHKEIDRTLLREKVPRLILQPIIENAVEHGVSPSQTGVILIRVRREGERLLLEIRNNRPMTKEAEERVSRLLSPGYDARSEGSLHLGIHNVNLRLRMIFGDACGLAIRSVGEDTVATIDIPLAPEELRGDGGEAL